MDWIMASNLVVWTKRTRRLRNAETSTDETGAVTARERRVRDVSSLDQRCGGGRRVIRKRIGGNG